MGDIGAIVVFLFLGGAFFWGIQVIESRIREVLTKRRLDRLDRMIEDKKSDGSSPSRAGEG
jgi:hypothetical protein